MDFQSGKTRRESDNDIVDSVCKTVVFRILLLNPRRAANSIDTNSTLGPGENSKPQNTKIQLN